MVAEHRASKKVKQPKTKEILHWSEALDKFWPNHPKAATTPKDIKIYTSICAKIDKESVVSSNMYVHWVVENWSILGFKSSFPKLSEFCLGYQNSLHKYIETRTYTKIPKVADLRARNRR